MKILVVSEGKNDLGTDAIEGALPILVKRIIAFPVQCTARSIRDTRRRIHGRENAWLKKVMIWSREARDNGHDALVLVVDRDRDPRRQPALSQAQSDARILFPRAVGVAIESFDAWMIADETALSNVLNMPVPRRSSPESVRDPKAICLELMTTSQAKLPLTECYSRIAQLTRLEVLRATCQAGFGEFHDRVVRITQ